MKSLMSLSVAALLLTGSAFAGNETTEQYPVNDASKSSDARELDSNSKANSNLYKKRNESATPSARQDSSKGIPSSGATSNDSSSKSTGTSPSGSNY